MNILFLSSYYPPNVKGGAELSTQLIAEGLVKLGHHVQVITAGSIQKTTNQNGVAVSVLPVPLTAKPLFERRHSQFIARYLLNHLPKLHDFDLIHAHDFRTVLVLAELQRLNLSITKQTFLAVATIRDYAQISGSTNFISANGTIPSTPLADAFLSHRINEASFIRKPFRLWQYLYNLNFRARSFAAMSAQVYISKAQQELIAAHQAVKSLSTVIYNPVAEDYLTKPVTPGQKGQLAYVGAVENYKGVGLLLAACPDIFSAFPDARLKIIGDGADKKRYQQQVAAAKWSNCVTFTGRLPAHALLDHYDLADIVICPHVWIEPFGRTCAEAMARGKILVAADCGGPAEMITDGLTGFLFKRNDVNSLTQKISQALALNDQQKNIIGSAARSWASTHLNQENIARQHEAFYKKTLGKPVRPSEALCEI